MPLSSLARQPQHAPQHAPKDIALNEFTVVSPKNRAARPKLATTRACPRRPRPW